MTRSVTVPSEPTSSLRGPRVRARFAASLGTDLSLDGVLRPVLGLREGGLRGAALVYGLTDAAAPGRGIAPETLNSVDAERVDMAALEAALASAPRGRSGERPPLLILPVSWTTARGPAARRRLLRRAAEGQLARGVLAVCEITGLEPGIPPAQLREGVGALQPIFRGVLARVGASPDLVHHLAGCGFNGATVQAAALGDTQDEAAMLRQILRLQTLGPGVLVHGVRSVAALTAIRSAGASWASLDIVAGGREARDLLAETHRRETKTATRSPGSPHLLDET